MAATYEPIASQTLGSAAASVTLSSISSSYTDLRLVAHCATSDAASKALLLRFNNDTGANYSYTRLYGSGSSAISDRFQSGVAPFPNYIDVGFMPGGGNGLGIITFDVMSYANTNVYKTVLNTWESEEAASGSQYVARVVGLWRSTSAINEIDLVFAAGNIIAGSTFSLYGIKAA